MKPDNEAEAFHAAGFAGPQLVVVPDDWTIVRSVDDLVAWTFSTSSTAPHLFGHRLVQFETDLRRVLTDVSPEGLFAVRLPDNELRIWHEATP